MTKTFNFCKQTVKHDGTVVPSRNYPVTAADDNSVTFRQVNALRIVAFKLAPIEEEKAKDGKDVSGAGVNSPSQIIWDGNKFVAVPYSDEYVRVSQGSGSSSECLMKVSEWMANHQKPAGKRLKGQPTPMIPAPIATYDDTVYIAITGRMKQHALKSEKILTIDLTGVNGFGEEQLKDLEIANDFIGCNVHYLV